MSFLGITVKAGKVCFGYDCVKEGIVNGKVRLVIVTSDLSAKSKKNILYIASRSSIELIQINHDMDEIYRACGKYCGVLGIKDKGMAIRVKELANEDYSGRNV